MGIFFRALRAVYGIAERVASIPFGSLVSARAVVLHDGRILAIDQGAYLELPGGKLRPGETSREGVVREIEEETGVKVEPVERIKEESFGPVLEILYRAEARSIGELEGSWEGRPTWVPLPEVDEREWHFHPELPGMLDSR
jgi:8-oxo-dGTP pyrophosphatase MutT (NUDIX family)